MSTVTKMPDDLYDCYVLNTEEANKSLLETITGEENRAHFLRTNQPWSREEFVRRMANLTPVVRQEIEKEWRTPYQQLLQERLASCEQALHEYDLDPNVRERTAKECQEILERALQPNR